jgi:hypothetical protein
MSELPEVGSAGHAYSVNFIPVVHGIDYNNGKNNNKDKK